MTVKLVTDSTSYIQEEPYILNCRHWGGPVVTCNNHQFPGG
jgi:hypothetical protein